MKKYILRSFRWYFSNFFIRKGKMPVLNLITKLGLTKDVRLVAEYDRNIRINLDLEDWIQKQIFFFGRYEVEKLQTFFWQKNVKQNQVILDVGANIGYYALMAAKRIGNGRVYAFEPVKKTFEKLEENIRLNGFENISIFNLAVSDSEKPLELYVGNGRNTGTSSITNHHDFSGKMETVPAITLDRFVENEKIGHIDYIKIDVEGAEMMVLKGARETLNSHSPVVLIELLESRLKPAGSSISEVYHLFSGLKYHPFVIDKRLKLVPVHEPVEGSLIIFKKG